MTTPADRIARSCQAALHAELLAGPKPGLVSLSDPGAHGDMTAVHFERSIDVLGREFGRLATAGSGCFAGLRDIGGDAETAMLDVTGGVNTHRGAIFALGLLAASAGAAGPVAEPALLRRTLMARWGADLAVHPGSSHHKGALARRRFATGGAPAQAAAGFPAVFDVGLPAFRAALGAGLHERAALVETLMRLVATVVDTNVLHRGGPGALRRARSLAASFLSAGGCRRRDWEAHATAIHCRFVRQGMSPGGCADLLAATLLVHDLTVVQAARLAA